MAWGGTSDLRDRLDEAARRRPEELKAAAEAIAKALDGMGPDAAAEAIAPTHWPVIGALANRPDCADVAKRLLQAAYGPAAAAPAPAPPQAEVLAKEAVLDPDFAKRFDAAAKLKACYGERAVPCLLPYLRSQDDAMVNAHITLMSRMGREAALPLAAAVLTKDAHVRDWVALELGVIGDPRALPVLLELEEAEQAGNDPAPKPSAVARAVAKLRANAGARGGPAAAAYSDMGRRYLESDPSVARFPRGQPPLVWNLEGDRLVSRTAERHLYFIELARCAAQDALRLDPGNKRALELMERLAASEELAERLVADLRR